MAEARRPTFLGIGAPKCATTWLAENLRAHPEVFVSNPKELHYFSSNYDHGFAWYSSHFNKAKGYKAIGEVSTSYFHNSVVPQRILDTLGEVRCIAIVRDPVERFMSDVKHAVRDQKIDLGNRRRLNEGDLNAILSHRPELERRSLYYDALKNFRAVLGSRYVLVLNQADLKSNPDTCLAYLWGYLGVDSRFISVDAGRTVSRGIIPRYAALEQVRKALFKGFRNVPGIIPFVRKSGLSTIYRRVNRGRDIKLTPGARASLWKRFYTDWDAAQEFIYRP